MKYFIFWLFQLVGMFSAGAIGWMARGVYLEAKQFAHISFKTKRYLIENNLEKYKSLKDSYEIVNKVPFLNKTLY